MPHELARLEQAGGRVTGLDGLPWNPATGHILASNGLLHDEMLAIANSMKH